MCVCVCVYVGVIMKLPITGQFDVHVCLMARAFVDFVEAVVSTVIRRGQTPRPDEPNTIHGISIPSLDIFSQFTAGATTA